MQIGATLLNIKRIASGSFHIANAVKLDTLNTAEDIKRHLIPVNQVLSHIESITIDQKILKLARHGARLYPVLLNFGRFEEGKLYKLVYEHQIVAIIRYKAKKIFYERVFVSPYEWINTRNYP